MVTAKLLNYTFVRRSESSMQIAPPKGDDDVAVPCLKEKGRHEAASQPTRQQPSCNNPISVLDSGEILPLSLPPAHNTPHFTADPSLPAADFTRLPRARSLSHFIKLRRSFFTTSILQNSVQRLQRFQPCFVEEKEKHILSANDQRYVSDSRENEVGHRYFMDETCGWHDRQRAQHPFTLLPSLCSFWEFYFG